MDYVFGYGSIVSAKWLPKFMSKDISEITYQKAELKGFVRAWNVAKDNFEPNARKRYRDCQTNDWFEGSPTFLNIYPTNNENTANVNGIIVQVDEQDLMRFDIREEHYDRVDVTEHIVNAPKDATIYAYVGREKDIKFYENARDCGKAKTPKFYIDMLEEAFNEFGEDEYEQYIKSTIPPEVQSADIELIIFKSFNGEMKKAG